MLSLRPLRIALLLVLISVASLATLSPSRVAHADTGITHIGRIGGIKDPNIDTAAGTAVDSTNNVFVADYNQHKIRKFNSNGVEVLTWGSNGTANSEFNFPSAVAVDGNNDVYVADTNNFRVQKFDNNGNFITQWGGLGNQPGQFTSPQDIAIDPNDNVYVVDTGASIQKFDSNGNYISQFGSEGTNNGEFLYASGCDIDASGNIYVVDSGNNRIQKFDSNGNYITKWGSSGSSAGEFGYPKGIGVDPDGNSYIADRQNNRIQKFDTNGNFITQWSFVGQSFESSLTAPYDVDVASSGKIYVADTGHRRIVKYESDGTYISIAAGYDESQAINTMQISVSQNGNIYIINYIDFIHTGLAGYDPSGQPILYTPEPSIMDANVVASPAGLHTLSFDGSEFSMRQRDFAGITNSHFSVPQPSQAVDVAVDSEENIYSFNNDTAQVTKYDSNGTIVNQFGSLGSGNSQFNPNLATYMTVDTNDNLYVADSRNFRIQKFDKDGNFLLSIPIANPGTIMNDMILGLAVSPEGWIYASDFSDHNNPGTHEYRITKYDSNGNFVSEYAPTQEYSGYYGLAAGPNGRLYHHNNTKMAIEILCDNDVSSNGCIDTQSTTTTSTNVTTTASVNTTTPIPTTPLPTIPTSTPSISIPKLPPTNTTPLAPQGSTTTSTTVAQTTSSQTTSPINGDTKGEAAVKKSPESQETKPDPWLILGRYSVTGSNAIDIIIIAILLLVIGYAIYKIEQKIRSNNAWN